MNYEFIMPDKLYIYTYLYIIYDVCVFTIYMMYVYLLFKNCLHEISSHFHQAF